MEDLKHQAAAMLSDASVYVIISVGSDGLLKIAFDFGSGGEGDPEPRALIAEAQAFALAGTRALARDFKF